MTRLAVDSGVTLNVEVTGEGPAVLLLHGFMGSAAVWTPHLPALTAHYRVLAVDLVGHGGSDVPVDPSHYRMESVVQDLMALLRAVDVGSTALLGYSMGARVALNLAVAAPDLITHLILESGTAGLADAGERRARRADDERRAWSIETRGVAAFADEWECLPLFATQRTLPSSVLEAQRRDRTRHVAVGLANSLRCTGTGAQASLWETLETVTMPTLLVAGGLDDKFARIAREMAALIPCASLAIVPDAGHAVHLEQPETFDGIVTDFLARRSKSAS